MSNDGAKKSRRKLGLLVAALALGATSAFCLERALSYRRAAVACRQERGEREREVRGEKGALLVRLSREASLARPGRAMLYGASHMEGLMAQAPREWAVRAVGCWTSDDLARNFGELVEPFRPRALVIAMGLNDPASGMSVGRSVKNLQAMADRMQRWGGRAIVVLPLPAGRGADEEFLRAHRGIEAWRRAYARLVSSRHDLVALDVWPSLAGPEGWLLPGLTSDGLHLNREGRAMLLRAIEGALGKLWEP